MGFIIKIISQIKNSLTKQWVYVDGISVNRCQPFINSIGLKNFDYSDEKNLDFVFFNNEWTEYNPGV